MDCDWAGVARAMTGPNPAATPIWYQKHMAHHMVGPVAHDDLPGLRHAFLIRDPRRVAASYAEKRDGIRPEHLGINRQRDDFRREADRLGHAPPVADSADVLRDKRPVGRRVAVIGAGGIGFDVGEYLTHEGESGALAPAKFNDEWGIDTGYAQAGGLRAAQVEAPTRQVHLLQRKTSKVGDQLGKTTGWIHRTSLKARNVGMSSGVAYERVDDVGLHITIDGQPRVLDVDHIVVCAGQEPLRELLEPLKTAGVQAHLIGGADVAAELDAKRAIDQGSRLAAGF